MTSARKSKYSQTLSLLGLLVLPYAAATQAQTTNEAYLSEDELYNEELSQPVVISDPLETINRYTFKFNDFVYMKVLAPVAKGYTAVTPEPVQRGAINFFQNLKYPVRLAGNLLQGRVEGAWVETKRFAVNSTLGVAGIFRPVDEVEGFAPIPPEDIGQALGSWGVGEGPYLVLPLLGPSNLRDLGGYIGDRAVNPLEEPFSLIDDWDWEWRLALGATELVTTSPIIIKRYIDMKGQSIDPYSAMKNGYIQLRRAAVEE